MTNDDDGGNEDGIERRVVETLIDLREERGWSQSELARRMVDAGWPKYTQMTVSRTEKGDRPIRLNEAESLAQVFDVELYNLWSPRQLRRLGAATEQVSRLASDLEKLIDSYLDAQFKLASIADHVGLPEDEVSIIAAELLDTPETIAARVRANVERNFGKMVDEIKGEHRSEKERIAEDRFWQTPASKRRLVDLFGELNGKHPKKG
ncbi:helix-turn-helix transcriptional regulator [Pseudarthrobacter sp. MDT3-1]